jgi:hypothetical protein
MPLPEWFCWTRFGAEAGQSIDKILTRKEEERVANGGVFFWGIGNAIGPSMLELIRLCDSPEAVFSPIRSAPRREDAAPSSVVYWTGAETLAGEHYSLPECSMITSRSNGGGSATKHYALVCYRESPIEIAVASDKVEFARLRNVLTGRPVGASQVTAVVRHMPPAGRLECPSYEVTFRARLIAPYLIVLRAPVALPSADRVSTWENIVRDAWSSKVALTTSQHKRA